MGLVDELESHDFPGTERLLRSNRTPDNQALSAAPEPMLAGTEVVLRCVAAVLGAIPDDLAFWFNMDARLLRRRARRVRYHEPIEGTDKPFWTSENKALVGPRVSSFGP